MQTTVMGQCLNALLPSGERTVENRVRAAAEAGISFVEPFGGTWPADADPRRTAEVVRREGDRRGVSFPAFGSNTRLGATDSQAALKREAEACQILGARVLTTAVIDAPPIDPASGLALPFERAIGGLIGALRELTAEAAERGVRIAVLNHCAVVYLSWHQEWLVRLADRVPPGWAAGAAVDPGNYLYYAGEGPVAATRRLARHAALVRIGDWRPRPEAAVREELARSGRLSLWESAPLGEGVVDHAACFRLLREAGYNGIVSLKSPGPAVPDAAMALRSALGRLRQWVEEG